MLRNLKRERKGNFCIHKILSHQRKCRRIMFKKIYIFPIRCNVATLFFPHRLLILPKSNISWKVEKVFSSNFALTFYGEAAASRQLHAGSWSICQALPSVFLMAFPGLPLGCCFSAPLTPTHSTPQIFIPSSCLGILLAFHFPPKCIKKYCCCMVGYEQRVSFLIKFMVIVSTVNLSKFFMLRTKLCQSQPLRLLRQRDKDEIRRSSRRSWHCFLWFSGERWRSNGFQADWVENGCFWHRHGIAVS